MSKKANMHNWGLYPKREVQTHHPRNLHDVQQILGHESSLIARGNGRCYGDSSLGDTVVSMLHLNRFLSFDEKAGVLHCEAGVLLDDVLKLIVPRGFFLPVSPGTKFITIGGALASDIHGKNHHVDGVFSDHVVSFTLLDANGTLTEVFPDNPLFAQTAGGMGLTGIIHSVAFSLKRIETSYMKVTQRKARSLQEIFDLFAQHPDPTYSVAWIDCLAGGKSFGRSILMTGEHAKASEVSSTQPLKLHKKPGLNIPFHFPSWALNRWSVKTFNTLYYNKPGMREGKPQIIHYDSYFYPLDSIHHWNRIYGKRGFTQYQCVLPPEVSLEGISEMLGLMQKNGQASFLAVLKLFGKGHKDRYLHFPMEGYTLAVDFQINDKVLAMLDRFDTIVRDFGGKVYLTKDARMSAEMFNAMYPQRLAAGKFCSAQAERLGFRGNEVTGLS